MQIELIKQSFFFVISDGGFIPSVMTNLLLSMAVGAMLNSGIAGFRISISILLPYILVIALPTTLRIINYASRTNGLSYTAFNSLNTLTLMSIVYLVGIFIGHHIKKKAHRDAEKEVIEQMNTKHHLVCN